MEGCLCLVPLHLSSVSFMSLSNPLLAVPSPPTLARSFTVDPLWTTHSCHPPPGFVILIFRTQVVLHLPHPILCCKIVYFYVLNDSCALDVSLWVCLAFVSIPFHHSLASSVFFFPAPPWVGLGSATKVRFPHLFFDRRRGDDSGWTTRRRDKMNGASTSPAAAVSHTILVVDDVSVDRRLASRCLQRVGYHVRPDHVLVCVCGTVCPLVCPLVCVLYLGVGVLQPSFFFLAFTS